MTRNGFATWTPNYFSKKDSSLKTHAREMQDRPLLCDFCRRAREKKRAAWRHVRARRGEEEKSWEVRDAGRIVLSRSMTLLGWARFLLWLTRNSFARGSHKCVLRWKISFFGVVMLQIKWVFFWLKLKFYWSARWSIISLFSQKALKFWNTSRWV